MHLREVNKKIEILLMELEEIINSENSKEGKEKLNLFIEKWKKIYRFLINLEGRNYTYFHLSLKK